MDRGRLASVSRDGCYLLMTINSTRSLADRTKIKFENKIQSNIAGVRIGSISGRQVERDDLNFSLGYVQRRAPSSLWGRGHLTLSPPLGRARRPGFCSVRVGGSDMTVKVSVAPTTAAETEADVACSLKTSAKSVSSESLPENSTKVGAAHHTIALEVLAARTAGGA